MEFVINYETKCRFKNLAPDLKVLLESAVSRETLLLGKVQEYAERLHLLSMFPDTAVELSTPNEKCMLNNYLTYLIAYEDAKAVRQNYEKKLSLYENIIKHQTFEI